MLTRRLIAWAEAKPDAIAIITDNVQLSYRQFVQAIAEFQRPLLEAKLEHKGVVAIVSTKR